MSVADVDGVKLAGLLFDAGTTNSPALLRSGRAGSARSHAANPTTVQDVFFRIGGRVAGKATTSLVVNSNNTIIDHIWVWRADHGAGVGWTINTADHGPRSSTATTSRDRPVRRALPEVRGDLERQGRPDVIFFQNEKPYDPPNQAAWRNGSLKGYAAYKVANRVTSFTGLGPRQLRVLPGEPVGQPLPHVRGAEHGRRLHTNLAIVSLGGVGSIVPTSSTTPGRG